MSEVHESKQTPYLWSMPSLLALSVLTLVAACNNNDVSNTVLKPYTPLCESVVDTTGACRSTDYIEPGPYDVAKHETITLFDPQRGREVEVSFNYPSLYGALIDTPEPLPVILALSGFGGHAEEMDVYAEHLVERGYIVVGITFPYLNFLSSYFPVLDDLVEHPGDVSFVIDAVLGDNPALADQAIVIAALQERVDPTKIGILGLSAGGFVTLMTSFDREMHDPRIRVAVTMAAFAAEMMGPDFFESAEVPILLIHGSHDLIVGYEQSSLSVYDYAKTPKALLYLEHGSHAGFLPFESDQESLELSGCRAGLVNPDFFDWNNWRSKLANREPTTGVINNPPAFPGCESELADQAIMNPQRQIELSTVAMTAFLQAELSSDFSQRESAGFFLRNEFSTEHQDTNYSSE